MIQGLPLRPVLALYRLLKLILICAIFTNLTICESVIPPFSSLVVDTAEVFAVKDKEQLHYNLLRFREQSGFEIAVLTLNSLDGEPIEFFSQRVAKKWQTGLKNYDSGVIVVFALKDRQVRIETGRGAEGALPDIIAGRIIREQMIPLFKSERYDQGLIQGCAAIIGGLNSRRPWFERW